MPSKTGLLWPILASLALPLAAAWFVYPQTHVPPGFGVFPPLYQAGAPGFSLAVFIVLVVVELGIAAFLLFPRLFGFKPVVPPAPAPRAKYPPWFWIGALLMLFFWWLMWKRTTPFGPLVYYAFTPLWWGLILVLDGLVYRRNNGRSLFSVKRRLVFLLAVISLVAWTYFEYFNYFVLSNWYYPNSNTMPQLGHGLVVVLFLVAYTTVWPVILEAYALLRTFPALAVRYSDGPKVALPGNLLLWAGLLLVVLMVFLPYPLFWAVWIGPLLILSGALIRLGIWTPYTALAQGNWNPALLVSLASLFIAVFWEGWNYGSAHPANPVTNPNDWMYDVPYVNVIHLFSEMPLLGFAGYLPFGLMVWLVLIWAGEFFGFDTSLDLD